MLYITMEQLCNGSTNYFNKEIVQKASGKEKFIALMALPGIPIAVKHYAEQFRENPIFSSMFNEDGLIDIDQLRERATAAMQETHSFDLAGYRFAQPDIEAMYSYLQRG